LLRREGSMIGLKDFKEHRVERQRIKELLKHEDRYMF
jgi:hypothetical protein